MRWRGRAAYRHLALSYLWTNKRGERQGLKVGKWDGLWMRLEIKEDAREE